MTLSPLNFRVPEFTRTGNVLQQLGRNLESISDLQQQIASGNRYDSVSDAPLSVRRMLTYDRFIERTTRFQTNIELADSRLSTTESSLQELSSVIQRARNLGLQLLNDTASTEQRQNAAIEVGQLVEEAVLLSNRMFGDRYLFGGSEVSAPPFERVGDFVAYRGDEQSSTVAISIGIQFQDSITGAQAFGGLSSEIVGRNDLNPIVTLGTALGELNNGRGVAQGEIEVRDGLGGRVFVDLEGANTMDDVLERLNATGLVSATISPSGSAIDLAAVDPAADLDILDVAGATTASDLGIAGLNQGVSLAGLDLDPIANERTPISELFGGAGLDLSGLQITNGLNTVDVSFAGATTLEDIIGIVERSGANVFAEISADGRSLAIRSNLAGAELTLEELGGTTGADLGLILPPEDYLLDSLNGGTGVQDLTGSDFQVRLSDGTTFEIDIQSATTLGDVADLLRDHPQNGGKLTVAIASNPTRLELQDATAGAEDFAVDPLAGSFTAAQLGIQQVGAAGQIVGEDLRQSGSRLTSIFDGLVQLQRGLASDDRAGIEASLRSIDRADTQLLQARGELGIRIRRLEISATRTETERFQLQELRSREGDTDLASAIVEFQQQQTVYQAALQTAGQLLQPSLLDFLG